MNNLQKNFIFLSQIVGLPVIDLNTGKKIGRITDIVAALREMYPRVTGLMFRRGFRDIVRYIPWKAVKKVVEDRAIYIDNPEACAGDLCLSENEILLKETFWDKQIVDISGSKVVRVNDLHLLKEDLNLWLVHMDVGISGLIRRLGWIKGANFITQSLFSTQLTDRLISWKFVQPIEPRIRSSEALSLKVHHSQLSELHPADLADIITDLGTDERATILSSLDMPTAAQTFQELAMKIRVQIAESISQERLIAMINEMAVDESVDLLSKLSKKKTTAILARLPADKAFQITGLLGHSERIAGSIMNTEFVAVRQSATASRVLEKIRTDSKKKESIYYIYILDDNEAMAGVVTLRQVLLAPPEKTVAEFMRRRIVKTRVDAKIDDVAEIFYKYDFTVVPVVDRQNRLQGIITMKDAFESVFSEIREETEETQ